MLSLVAIMLDEIDYVERWVQGVTRLPAMFDEIVIVDGGSSDGTTERLRELGIRDVFVNPWSGDYAAQRNFAIDRCKHDWVFELDADEIASTALLAGVRKICGDLSRDNEHRRQVKMLPIDSVGIARLNFIDDVLVAGPGHRGLDYQYRLHSRDCRWQKRVHEELINPGNRIELDVDDGHFIRHVKSSARHLRQNAYYEILKEAR